jgi:hypothetical protein
MVGPRCSILLGRARQIELHPRHVVPTALFPYHASVQAGVLEPEGSMEPVVELGDAGDGLPVGALGESMQQLTKKVRVLRRRGDGRCPHTSLGRPLEGGQALQGLPMREADDLICRSRTSHSWVTRSAPMRAAISPRVATSMSQLMAVLWTQVR